MENGKSKIVPNKITSVNVLNTSTKVKKLLEKTEY
jgi:hypothetical protein